MTIATQWNSLSFPQLFQRTSTQYSVIDLETLELRGIYDNFLLDLVEKLPEGAMIAGGYYTSLFSGVKPNDLDIFFTSEEAFNKTMELFTSRERKKTRLGQYKMTSKPEDLANPNKRFIDFEKIAGAAKPGPKIQLIKTAWYMDVKHLIDTFDFTVAQFGSIGYELYVNPTSFLDLYTKKLVAHRTLFPADTLRRIIKYADKGYFVCSSSLNKFVELMANGYNPNMRASGGTLYAQDHAAVFVPPPVPPSEQFRIMGLAETLERLQGMGVTGSYSTDTANVTNSLLDDIEAAR